MVKRRVRVWVMEEGAGTFGLEAGGAGRRRGLEHQFARYT